MSATGQDYHLFCPKKTFLVTKKQKPLAFSKPLPLRYWPKALSPNTAPRELFHTQQTVGNAPNRSRELQTDLRITTCIPRDPICTGCASICPIPNIVILIV